MSSISQRFALTALTITITAVLAGAAYVRISEAEATPSAVDTPAAAVDVKPAREQVIHDQREYSGRLEAVENVQIRPQVSGTITQVHFDDGSLVEAGDVLFTIDPRPYKAAVARARAELAAAKARAV